MPPLDVHHLGETSIDVVPTVLIVGALVLYLAGVARVRRLTPRHPWKAWRTACFIGGLAVTFVSVELFVGAYDDVLFYDHMVQHLALIMVAAGLFALSSPIYLTWRATTGAAHRRVTALMRSAPARFFDRPVVAFVLYALVIPISHLTSFYNETLQNETLHDFEHLLFLVVGYLFWRPVVGYEPGTKLHPAMKMVYLAAAVPVDTFTGLALASARHNPFPYYDTVHRTWGPSRVEDIHIGGVIMWVVGDSLMLLAMIPVAISWMRYEERRAVRVDRELDATLWADPDVATGP
ncbi:MAG TPA: cytochrome c oxidase assembly protein [Acidimicrobiales bacterium]|nr:cytochrome c oxidase assembly protein [Acidimicrobiales bacterium]